MNNNQSSKSGEAKNDDSKPPDPSSPEEEIVIKAHEIFQGAKEIQIEHGDEVYRLIITRNNKLILHS